MYLLFVSATTLSVLLPPVLPDFRDHGVMSHQPDKQRAVQSEWQEKLSAFCKQKAEYDTLSTTAEYKRLMSQEKNERKSKMFYALAVDIGFHAMGLSLQDFVVRQRAGALQPLGDEVFVSTRGHQRADARDDPAIIRLKDRTARSS